MKNKTIKNYFILFGIFVVTFVICFYLFSWIKQYNEVKLGEPIIVNTLKEIKYDNLDNYLKENEVVAVYMCTTYESSCRIFEKKFSTFVKEQSLTDNILYFNLGYKSVENNLLDNLYNKYKNEYLIKKITNYPTIVIFNNGKIIDFLTITSNSNMDIVEEFLEGYDIDD